MNPEKEPNGMFFVFTAEYGSKTSRTGRIGARAEKSQPRRGRGSRDYPLVHKSPSVSAPASEQASMKMVYRLENTLEEFGVGLE